MDAARGGFDALTGARGGTGKEKRGLYVSPLAPLPAVCFFFFGHERLILASLLAAALHECGHIAAIYALGAKIGRLEILPFGGEIETCGKILSYRQSLFVSFAGILANLLCVPLLAAQTPFLRLFGICSAGLALFNLLPARGLDGGEMLQDLLLMRLSPETAGKILTAASVLSAGLLILLFLDGLLFTCFNPLTLLLGLYLLFRALQRE